ncbi:GGDEF domain-containing protein [Xanthobacter sp. AM11]|uniref:GGDEF domain-containing protein n=1 Tax=Xanthobacter sp. AM11 TaxID=3380643 RepID=UPI0039BF67EC
MFGIRLYLFTGPAVSLIVGLVCLTVWFNDHRRRYLLFFAAAFIAYALAALSQMLSLPPDTGANTMVSAIIYTFAVLCTVEGLLTRFDKGGASPVLIALAGLVVVCIYYFFYFDRNLVARIYVQNFGYGIMFLIATAQVFAVERRRWVDALLFWIFALFGLHFFLRTLVTMSMSADIQRIDQMVKDGAGRAELGAVFEGSPFWQILNFSLLVSVILMALALIAVVTMDIIEDLKREGRADPLTGLSNRRGFDVQAAALFADSSAHPLSVVFCDIDRFKSINDTYGHSVGDRVLAAVGGIVAAELGPKDVAARLGGEEFVLLLANTNRSGAAMVAERLRSELELGHFPALPQHAVVTASFGVAERMAGEELLVLLHRADQMVYVAKRAGRNRIEVDDGRVDPSRPAAPRPRDFGDGAAGEAG